MARSRPTGLVSAFVVLMAAAGAVIFVAPRFDAVGWAAAGLGGAGAVVLGIHRVRPERPGAWWALAGALVAMMAGDFVYGLVAQSAAEAPPLADLCYLAMFPMVAVALISLTRGTVVLDDRARLLDLLALGCAAALAGWVFIGSPRAGTPAMTATDWSVQAAFTLGDVTLLVVTVRLVTAAPRNASAVLLAVGSLAMLAANVAYGVGQSHGGLRPGGPADVGYLVLYATWGAAALLPSMARLDAPAHTPPAEPEPVHRRGLALPLAAVAVPPLTLLGQSLTGPVRDGPVIAVASALTVTLLVLRLDDALGRHAAALRREQALRHAGTMLVGATDAGSVAVAVRAAVHRLLPAGAPHVIVVDSSLTDLLPLRMLAAPRTVPVGDTPPLWRDRFAPFDRVLVCPLDAAVLYVAAAQRDLRAVRGAVAVLAGQAALALARIGRTARPELLVLPEVRPDHGHPSLHRRVWEDSAAAQNRDNSARKYH